MAGWMWGWASAVWIAAACSAADSTEGGADASGGAAGGAAAEGNAGGGNAGGGNAGGENAGGGNAAGGQVASALPYDDIVEGCAKLVGCGLPDSGRPNWLRYGVTGYGNAMGLCVDSVLALLGGPDRYGDDGIAHGHVVACARAEATCHGFLECLSFDYDDAECDGGVGSICDGDRLVECTSAGSSQYLVRECGEEGMRCQLVGERPACALEVGCSPTDGVSCDVSGQMVSCHQGALVVQPCAPGMRCDASGAGPACVPTGAACETPGSKRCLPDGNAALCMPAGDARFELVVDCLSQKKTCDPANFACIPTATECARSTADACLDDASGFTGCANGVTITVPCARLGRTTCTYNAGHASCE